MSRMKNDSNSGNMNDNNVDNDLDKTMPTRVNPDQGDTVRTPVGDQRPDSDVSGETVPTQVSPDAPEPPGFEDTIPPPRGTYIAENSEGTEGGGLPPQERRAGSGNRMPSWRLMALLGVLVLAVFAVSSAFAGYRAGISQRTSAEATQVTVRVEEQFNKGLEDMQAGRYDLARQRFEYVIQLNPNYPGATDQLAQVLLELNATATPTVAPTPTVSPTPDNRGSEELFAQAQEHLFNEEWTPAIETLLTLRKVDPDLNPVEVDDMMYVALRNRGKNKILVEGDLEGGIYDLTLAQRFGPLDTDAQGYLQWAELYLTGASFWELDWGQAVYYFGQVAPALPNLRDGSGYTATERYRLALINFGDYLGQNEDWCQAEEQYAAALEVGSDPDVEEQMKEASKKCSKGEGNSNGERSSDAQDAPIQPTVEEPAPVQPTATQAPVSTEPPATTQPATTQPATTQPATTEAPATTEPPPSEPSPTPNS
jgi:tetratricopeptide (TPR) repeat protein